jgi:hypothetical protein
MNTISAAHRCLFIGEVYANIVGHLRSFPKPLARLALTCRAFSEPALNMLWYQLTGLRGLCLVMPDIWELRTGVHNNKRYHYMVHTHLVLLSG